jgi:hypothetical protein
VRRALAAILVACVACGGSSRDVVPETHDVVATAGTARGTYEYVARRPLGFVALARETGLGDELGKRTADRMADALDACATSLAAKGKLVDGAIRLEAMISRDGDIAVSRVTVAPGDAVAANALLCVVTPLKLTTFPPGSEDAGVRSFAVDASWGPATAAAPAQPRP